MRGIYSEIRFDLNAKQAFMNSR